MKLIRKWFYRAGNILKFKPTLHTLQHDTQDLTIKTTGAGTDIYVDGRRAVFQSANGEVITAVDTNAFQTAKPLLPVTDGDLAIGDTTHQFNRAYLKHSIFSPLQFTEVGEEPNFGNAPLLITLPHEVPSADYMVIITLDNEAYPNLCKVEVLDSTRTTTDFEINGYGYDGALLDCTGNPITMHFMLFFPNA